MYTAGVLAVLAAQLSGYLVAGSPFPRAESIPPTTCTDPVHQVTIDTQGIQDGAAFVGGVSIPGSSGGTLSLTESYSVGYTFTEGGDLGVTIDEVIGAGISFSVSETTSTTIGEGGNIPCPSGGWQCALSITPTMVGVSGNELISFENCDSTGTYPYTALVPQVDAANNAIIAVDVCACPDYPSWADEGAPATCPGNCK